MSNKYINAEKVFEEINTMLGRKIFYNKNKTKEFHLLINEYYQLLETFDLNNSNFPNEWRIRKGKQYHGIDDILKFLKDEISNDQYNDIHKFCFENI